MNILKKDIIVKNSIKPRTYLDYDTARLFYETNRILDLPEEIQDIIMNEVKRWWIYKYWSDIYFGKKNIQHIPFSETLRCCTILKSGKRKGSKCGCNINNCDTYCPDKYKYEYDRSKGMTPPDILELIARTRPLSRLRFTEKIDQQYKHFIEFRLCGRHTLNIYDFKQALKYLNIMGYDLQNGYLIKKK